MTHQWIDSDRGLAEFLDRGVAGRYALDTEFHRERTYFPQLALVQLRIDTDVALIDPLVCNLARLVELLSSDAICVLHAGTQDLEVLFRACGVVPRRIHDTQIAAGFLGYSQASLSSLVYDVRKVSLPKTDRLTDWLRRPLTQAQIDYAASDVEHLFEIHDHQTHALKSLNRTEWVDEACQNLLNRSLVEQDLDDAWLKVKDARSLRGEARGVARALARWREERAMKLDIPVRRVISDMALVSIAQAKPRTASQVQACRGVDGRQMGSEILAQLIAAVERGLSQVIVVPETQRLEIDPRDRAVVPLIVAWAAEKARQSHLDPTFLATRHDVDEFLAGSSTCRLRQGWRADLLLEELEDLKSGKKGLRVDGGGHLVLVSVDPLSTD